MPPIVFHVEWTPDVKAAINSADNLSGHLTNSDLELAGLFLLWLAMEDGYISIDYVTLNVGMEGKSAMPMASTDYGPMG